MMQPSASPLSKSYGILWYMSGETYASLSRDDSWSNDELVYERNVVVRVARKLAQIMRVKDGLRGKRQETAAKMNSILLCK